MKIAILGWDSLIWNLRELRIIGEWRKGGPVLPIEFSRISSGSRLTLVIDNENGEDVATRYAVSAQSDLAQAVEDLRIREGCKSGQHIGFIDFKNLQNQCPPQNQLVAPERIRSWAVEHQFDGVIWTALKSNFRDHTNEEFSPEAAVRYLSQLEGQKKESALEYIRMAPAEVDTPFRRLWKKSSSDAPSVARHSSTTMGQKGGT